MCGWGGFGAGRAWGIPSFPALFAAEVHDGHGNGYLHWAEEEVRRLGINTGTLAGCQRVSHNSADLRSVPFTSHCNVARQQPKRQQAAKGS